MHGLGCAAAIATMRGVGARAGRSAGAVKREAGRCTPRARCKPNLRCPRNGKRTVPRPVRRTRPRTRSCAHATGRPCAVWEGRTGRLRQPGYRPTGGVRRKACASCRQAPCGEAGAGACSRSPPHEPFPLRALCAPCRGHTAVRRPPACSCCAISLRCGHWRHGAGRRARPVVVTATRLEQPLTDALPHTTVLSRDDIERSQAVDLPHAAGARGRRAVRAQRRRRHGDGAVPARRADARRCCCWSTACR